VYASSCASSTGEVAGAATTTNSGSAVLFSPASYLAAATLHCVRATTALRTDARDGAGSPVGQNLPANAQWEFMTLDLSDLVRPTVVAVSPPDQALGVPTNALLEVVFSEPVASSTITASSIALKKGTSAVAGTLSLRLPHVATFQPTTALSAGLYTASITTAVKDPAGNPLAEPVSFSFTVGTSSQLLPLQLAVQSPAPGQVAVATNRLVVATFSQQVAPSTVTTSTFTVSANGAPLAGTIALSGPDVVFLPGAPLPASTTVSVAASTELADLAGNHLAAPLSWSFTTGAGPDTTPPSISARSPADGASDVPVGAPIVLTFTEPLLPATVGPAALTLADGLGVAVAGALSLAGDTLSFQPSQPLSYRTSYVATFHHGPTDLAGNPSTADATISFTTAGLPGAHVVEVGAKVAAGALGDTNGDGARDVSDDEFVELLNTDAVPVDLSSWVLRTGSSSSTLVTRFTFPVGAQLAPGARAVVFGGGAPTGDFGGALVYAATSSLSLLDGGAWIELQEAGGLDADPPFLYPAAPTTGASLQRDPEVGGPFVAHTGPAGSTGVLWSPGTSPTGTRLKVNRLLSVPGSGAIGVDPTAPITLQLNTKLLFESVAGNTHLFASSCASSTGEVAGAATTTNAGTAILFTPAAPLAASALHCIRAGSGLRTDARDAGGTPVGRTLGAADSWEFTTFPPVDVTAPTVLALRPLDGATAVPSSTRIEVTFDEAIDPTTVTTSTITLTSAGGSVAGDLQFFPPASATFTPFGPLVEGEVYTATIATGVKDLAGNPLALPVTSVFTVATSTAPVPLQFLAVSPGAGAANVARNQSIVVAFDRAVASSTVDAGSFIVTASGTPVAGILSVSTTEVTFSPLALYPTSTTISLLLTTAIQDLAGNGLESSVVSSFTTTSGPPPFGVTLAVLAAPLQLTVLFSDPPDPVTGAVAGNYCIAAGSAVACSPSLLNVASATTTGSTATLTLGTVATPGATYRIFVAAVLRAADGAPLTAGSALFTAPAAPPFTLAAATSTFDTEIAVAFSQPPLDGAGAGAFCIAFTSSSDCSSPALAVAAVATSTAGSNVLLLTTTGQVKGLPYRVYAPGVVRASDGQACTSTIDLKGALLANGSFEADATSTTPTTAPPARWTMLTGAASGRLHARRADELTSLTSTAHGANVAWFDSLTASVGGREARSECFPLDATKPLTVRGATAVPAADAPAGTRASFKVWYFTDDLCSASSTTRAFDTQNSAANAAAGVWESRTYPVAAPPADAHSAWISLRALYAAPGTATSTIFFDALSVTQP
jgi:hypothetical protein